LTKHATKKKEEEEEFIRLNKLDYLYFEVN